MNIDNTNQSAQSCNMQQTQEHSITPFFSIVMPVYNSERYLASAIEGLLAQTYGSWELIIVDDASVDDSANIAQEYEELDSRIKLVHLVDNKGASAARNVGLEHTTANYVGFFDADDTYDPNMLQQVWESIQQNPADIVLFGLCEEYYDAKGNFQYSNEVLPRECVCKTPDEVHGQVLDLEVSLLLGYTWNKFYLRERMGDLRYEEGVSLIEDAFFNIEFFYRAKTANLLEISPYKYAKRQAENLTNKFVADYFELHRRRIAMVYEQQCSWGLDSPKVRSTVGALYGRYILSALERNCDPRSKMDHAARVGWCKQLFEDDLFCKLIPEAKAADSKSLNIGLSILRKQSAFLCCFMGRAIHIVRGRANKSYNKIKSKR